MTVRMIFKLLCCDLSFVINSLCEALCCSRYTGEALRIPLH